MVTPDSLPSRLWAASACCHRLDQRVAERLEPALGLADGGQIEQAAFGGLDLLARRRSGLGLEGVVDHLLAERDQFAAHMEIVDQPSIIVGIDDGRGGAGQAGEIAIAAQVDQVGIVAEITLQRDRVGDLVLGGERQAGLVDAAVQRFGEMLGAEEFGYPLDRPVVEQDRAQERLLRLEIVRRHPHRQIGAGIGQGNWFQHPAMLADGRGRSEVRRCG